MADYQRVIEFLRDVRQGGGAGLHTVTPELQQMATDYAALCAQANERLRQCSTFLQQGLRSEAIHQANSPPNLLDMVAQLDLPDPQMWAEFCINNGLPVPPALQLERAGQLNEAYAQDQPLEHLMSRQRLLALSRAPVRERLLVIRKIAQIDTSSPHWEKDIRVLEKARLKELPTAFYNAVKSRNERAIAALMEEVNQQPWFEAVPPDLSGGISEAHARVQRAGVEAELRKLVTPLREALAIRSMQDCQSLVQRWKAIMTWGGVTTVGPELMGEIDPVLAFIAEESRREAFERRFSDACRLFTRMLDDDEPDVKLEAAYARLKEIRADIPAELVERYTAKKSGRLKTADRQHKTRLTMIGVAAAVVVIMGLVVTYLLVTGHAEDTWADQIRASVNLHTKAGLDQAQARIDELKKNSPGMLKEPKVAAALNDLQLQQVQYAQDFQNIQLLASRLESAQQAATVAFGKATPSMDEIHATASALQKTIGETAEAVEKLNWADPDKKLQNALTAARSAIGTMQDRIVSEVKTELANVTRALEALPANPSTPEAANNARNKISALFDRVKALRDMPLLDDDSNTAIATLTDRIILRRQGADVSGDVAAELQNIRTHTSSAPDLAAALETFTRRFPNDPRSADFQTALKRMPAALSLAAWQQLVASFGNTLAAGSLQITQKRMDAVNAFLTANPGFPKFDEAAQYADYLKKAVEGLQDKGIWQVTFADLLANPLLTELTYMEVSDGTRYYTLGDIKRVDRSINNQVSVSFLAMDSNEPTKRLTITIDPPKTVSATPIRAPHTKLISDVSDSLKLIDERNWDTYGIDLADRLVHNDQMDLVVKAILLLKTLQTENTAAGWGLGETYDKVITDLSRQAPDQLEWMNPAKITDGTRKALKQAVDSIAPAATAKAKLAAAKATIFKAVNIDLSGIGVLLKEDSGAWNLSTHTVPANGEFLWTIAPASASNRTSARAPPPVSPTAFGDSTAADTTTLVLVGKGASGKYMLDDNVLRNMPQGSIVYITRQ